jgi:hypothetical protein
MVSHSGMFWDDGLGDQPDDESGDDRPEDVEHPRPPRGEVTLWSGQWNGGQQVEVELPLDVS